MAANFIPTREGELLTWAQTFNAHITPDPTIFGLDAAQAAAFSALLDTYRTAYDAANDNATRTPSIIIAKRDAKAALIANARELARIVQADPTVTDQQKSDLGLTVRDDEPTPIPAPSQAPEIDIEPPVVRSVRLRLHNEKTLGRRGKPDGVQGALIFSFVGPTPPAAEDTQLWEFQANTGRTIIDLQFPSSVPPGATVWFTAFWYNPRGISGPATPPKYTLLPGSMPMAA